MKSFLPSQHKVSDTQIKIIKDILWQFGEDADDNFYSGTCLTFVKMTFDEAHELIDDLKDELYIHDRRRQKWTEYEVRERLRRYNEDDAIFDARIARPSQMSIAHTSSSDPMPRMMYRLLKRVDLEKAIEGALIPPHAKARTREQKKKKRMYYLIRVVYILDLGVQGYCEMCDVGRSWAYEMENEAVGLITGFLNAEMDKKRKEKMKFPDCG